MDDVTKRIADLENYENYEYDRDICCSPELNECEASGPSATFGPDSLPTKRMLDTVTVDDNSRFSSLAKRFKPQESLSADIDSTLANTVTEIFRNGMEDDQYQNMLKSEALARPSNCDGLTVVKCNQLVWDLISPSARTTDKKLQNVETSVVKSATILAKLVDKFAKVEKKLSDSCNEDCSYVIDNINDAMALLGHANRQINVTRKDLLKPELRNEFTHLCNHQLPYTNQLFGDDVSKAAKEIEDCAKIGNKIQYGSNRGFGSYRSGRFGFRSRFRRPRGSRGIGRGYMQSGGGFDSAKNYPKRGGQRPPQKN